MSDIYLFSEQSCPGRCIVACNKHVNDITDLTDDERNAFFADVVKVSKAIQEIFHPDKVNYGAYNDNGTHLHVHVVPKYRGGFEWGTTFTMNAGRVGLADVDTEKMLKDLREKLA
jgi:diadenosine tetraphosphate (Ap4A) HIT family hydrolase